MQRQATLPLIFCEHFKRAVAKITFRNIQIIQPPLAPTCTYSFYHFMIFCVSLAHSASWHWVLEHTVWFEAYWLGFASGNPKGTAAGTCGNSRPGEAECAAEERLISPSRLFPPVLCEENVFLTVQEGMWLKIRLQGNKRPRDGWPLSQAQICASLSPPCVCSSGIHESKDVQKTKRLRGRVICKCKIV